MDLGRQPFAEMGKRLVGPAFSSRGLDFLLNSGTLRFFPPDSGMGFLLNTGMSGCGGVSSCLEIRLERGVHPK